MKTCPYCLADIHSDARKCKHCGEWVVEPENHNGSSISKADLEESLKTVNFVAHWKIIGAIISIPVAIIILIVFLSSITTTKDDVSSRHYHGTIQKSDSSEQSSFSENLQEYQKKVIQSGLPPLPAPLSQEMDDQLVEEGVLPPKEK